MITAFFQAILYPVFDMTLVVLAVDVLVVDGNGEAECFAGRRMGNRNFSQL